MNRDEADEPLELPARRGYTLTYRGISLLSRFDPVAQGERLTAKIPVKEKTLYLCPSPVYGYGLSLLVERLPGNSAILCVEADEKLFAISQKALNDPAYAGTEKDTKLPRLALLQITETGREGAFACAFVRDTWGRRRFRRVEVLRLTGGWQLYPRLYDDLANNLMRELAIEWGNAITLIRLGRLYTRNLIRNIALLSASKSISALDFGFSPVLVLGAGPSLDLILGELSDHSGGKIPGSNERLYKIACVDTCLPALLERGIMPDLVVILESQHWNLRDFTGSRGKKIDAAIDLSALPASVRVLNGQRFLYATAWTELTLMTRLEKTGLLPQVMPPMGSVGLSAVELALRAGKGPVLTGGIDFSFTLDAYHARSTPGQDELTRKQNRLKSIINAGTAFREGTFTALSKSGKIVRSDPAMRSYRNLFEQEFGGHNRLFDISGPGLPLGIKTISASEAFAILNGQEKTEYAENTDTGSTDDIASGSEKAAAFIREEINTLKSLRDMLSGETSVDTAALEALLDTTDYLWAHFPDYAGTDKQKPSLTDIGFLKRLRSEIDPFLKDWQITLEEIINRLVR